MKVPVDWLREYVAIEMPLDELAHRLAVTSCEVERDSADREELDAPCVREVRGDTEEVLLIEHLVARHEATDLQLE